MAISSVRRHPQTRESRREPLSLAEMLRPVAPARALLKQVLPFPAPDLGTVCSDGHFQERCSTAPAFSREVFSLSPPGCSVVTKTRGVVLLLGPLKASVSPVTSTSWRFLQQLKLSVAHKGRKRSWILLLPDSDIPGGAALTL